MRSGLRFCAWERHAFGLPTSSHALSVCTAGVSKSQHKACMHGCALSAESRTWLHSYPHVETAAWVRHLNACKVLRTLTRRARSLLQTGQNHSTPSACRWSGNPMFCQACARVVLQPVSTRVGRICDLNTATELKGISASSRLDGVQGRSDTSNTVVAASWSRCFAAACCVGA